MKRPTVVRYYDFKDKINLLLSDKNYIQNNQLVVDFFIAMPNSWSKKKKSEMVGMPHENKPDIDNVCKAFMDAVLKQDSIVHTLIARKFWSEEPMIQVYDSVEEWIKVNHGYPTTSNVKHITVPRPGDNNCC